MVDGPKIEPPPKRIDPNKLAEYGGRTGAKTITPLRSGEDAIKEWEREHGDIEESALERKKRLEETGEV